MSKPDLIHDVSNVWANGCPKTISHKCEGQPWTSYWSQKVERLSHLYTAMYSLKATPTSSTPSRLASHVSLWLDPSHFWYTITDCKITPLSLSASSCATNAAHNCYIMMVHNDSEFRNTVWFQLVHRLNWYQRTRECAVVATLHSRWLESDPK